MTWRGSICQALHAGAGGIGAPGAGVCMGGFPPDQFLADVAKEMNLSETAFVVPRAASRGGGGDGGGAPMEFDLRWFTPSGTEVDLCGRTWRILLLLATSQMPFKCETRVENVLKDLASTCTYVHYAVDAVVLATS